MQKMKIMMNGLPGNVATIITKHLIQDNRFEVIPFSLTGPGIDMKIQKINSMDITLVLPEDHQNRLNQIIKEYHHFIIVDFTHPSAVNANAALYCKNNLPFIMGTTGGDRDLLENTVKNSSISAVIAPNMAKQIVGFQAIMEYAANTFTGLFEGFSLTIQESHQKGKADTSGTAKAMVKYFNKLGTPFSEQDIIKERDPKIQEKNWGIAKEYLPGHAWHTYTLLSDDKNIKFEFKHNINGRDIYAGGVIDAAIYLEQKLSQKNKGQIYTMIDVLKKI